MIAVLEKTLFFLTNLEAEDQLHWEKQDFKGPEYDKLNLIVRLLSPEIWFGFFV